MQTDTSLLSRAANKVFTIFALVFHFHTYLLLVNTRLEKCLKCESASSCFQPGEGPSRGSFGALRPLLYPVHWLHGPRRAASIKWLGWCWNTANTHLTEQLVERGRVVEGNLGKIKIEYLAEKKTVTLHCSHILILEGWPWSEVESACVPTAGKHHCFWSGENQWS